MEVRIFGLRDKKIPLYLKPYFFLDQYQAQRQIMMAMKPDIEIHDFAEDFELVEYGSFDDQKGTFTLHKNPIHVAELVTLRNLLVLKSAASEALAKRAPRAAPAIAGENKTDVKSS